MFDLVSKSEVQPWVAFVIGALFIVTVSLRYRNFQYQKHLVSVLKGIRNFFLTLGNVVYKSWQFSVGVIFAVVISVAFILLSGGTYSHSEVVKTVRTVATTQPTHQSSARTIIDTSHPWTYDFSKVPSGTIDTRIFNIENGPRTANYNNELETYTTNTENVRVQDDALVLEAKPQSKDGKNYTSGRIDTSGSFDFLYGTLEVSARLPRGAGTWPAAWLMPSDPRYKAIDFPSATDQNRLYTLNGELDFLESVGYIQGLNIPAAHSYNSLGQPAQYTPAFTANPYDEYHTYGIIKTPDLIEFTLDGNVYATRTKTSNSPLSWPFNQSYYLILNLSIGGTWAGREGVDDSSAPWMYMIKSITYTPLVSA